MNKETMKTAIVALSLGSCLLPGLALGDELDDFADQLMPETSMRCTSEASTILANHIRNTVPDIFMDSLRESRQLGAAWKSGNENYRQARDVVEMALQDEEVKSGPIVDFSTRTVWRNAVASWTPAQREEYSAFFKQKGGRLFLQKMADNLMCPAIIGATRKPQFQVPLGAQMDRINVLELGLREAEQSMNVDMALLPNEQVEKVVKLMPGLSDSLIKAFGGLLLAAPGRAAQAVKPVVPELLKLAKAYKP